MFNLKIILLTYHFIIFAGEGSSSAAVTQVAAASTSSLAGEDDAPLGSSSDPEHSSSLSGDLLHRDRELDINDEEDEDQPGHAPHHHGPVSGKYLIWKVKLVIILDMWGM